MSSQFIIYALHHDDSNRVYVGQSRRGMERPIRHGYKHSLSRAPATLAAWIRKYKDRDGYKIAVLEECSSLEGLDEAEQFHIAYLRALGVPLLNMNDGGSGNRGRHIVLSDASRERIRAAMKKFAATPEGRAHMAKMTARNMKMTPEQRKAKGLKIAATRTGKTVSEVTKEKLRRANEGKKYSLETIEKRASKLRGRKRPPHIIKMLSERVCTEETRAKHRARMLGNKMSPESIAKMAATKRGRKQSPEAIAKRVAKITGQKQSPETIAKRAAANRGKKRSPEVRAQMRMRKASPETRAKLRAHMLGTVRSPETRAKISAVTRGRKQSPESVAKRVASAKLTREKRRNGEK